jgi:ABC-type enterochelin transport system permease subunit
MLADSIKSQIPNLAPVAVGFTCIFFQVMRTKDSRKLQNSISKLDGILMTLGATCIVYGLFGAAAFAIDGRILGFGVTGTGATAFFFVFYLVFFREKKEMLSTFHCTVRLIKSDASLVKTGKVTLFIGTSIRTG